MKLQGVSVKRVLGFGLCNACERLADLTVRSDYEAPGCWLVVRLCIACWSDAREYCESFEGVTGDRLYAWFRMVEGAAGQEALL